MCSGRPFWNIPSAFLRLPKSLRPFPLIKYSDLLTTAASSSINEREREKRKKKKREKGKKEKNNFLFTTVASSSIDAGCGRRRRRLRRRRRRRRGWRRKGAVLRCGFPPWLNPRRPEEVKPN